MTFTLRIRLNLHYFPLMACHYKTLRNGALAPTKRFASRQHWKLPRWSGAGKDAADFSSAFSQRSEWLAITRHFATALARLLNALQAGSIGSSPDGAVLATIVLSSQARSVSEVNGLPFA
jgi:hypothetical protein